MRQRSSGGLLFTIVGLQLLASIGHAATWTVDSVQDAALPPPDVTSLCPPSPGAMTLRYAFYCASNNAGDQEVIVPSNLGPGGATTEIQLTAGTLRLEDAVPGGGRVRVAGSGAARPIILGNTQAPHTVIESTRANADVELAYLDIRNGSGQYGGGFLHSQIASSIAVTIDDCHFSNNQAAATGGAVAAYAPLVVRRSRFSNNSAAQGGAVYLGSYNTATLESSEFTNNQASSAGGAVFANGVVFAVFSCTFEANTTTSGTGGGGAIAAYFSATGTIANSTFVENYAGDDNESFGGAIYANNSALTVRHCTVYNNDADGGGGGIAANNRGTIALSNSIVANNEAPPQTPNDCYCNSTQGAAVCDPINDLFDGAITKLGALHMSVLNETTNECVIPGFSSTDLVAPTGLATALANNGGLVRTLALSATAAALDAADSTQCEQLNTACVSGQSQPCSPADARAVTRPQAIGCDVGAFERAFASDVTIEKSANPATAEIGSLVDFTLTVTNAGPDPAVNVTVTDALPNTLALVGAPGCVTVDNTATCTIGLLPAGQSQTFVVTARLLAAGAIANTAVVTARDSDPAPDNNTSTVTVTSTAPTTGGNTTGSSSGGATGGVGGVAVGVFSGGGIAQRGSGLGCNAASSPDALALLGLVGTMLRRKKRA